MLGHHGMQLRMDVAPLAHTADVDKILTQQLLVLAVAEFVFCALAAAGGIEPFPEFQVAAEFALFIVKLHVRLVGLLLRLHRAVAHVLHAQGAGDHQHFVQRTPAARLQNHAAYTRVQRQSGQFLAHRREFVGIVHRTELIEQLVAVGNGAA